MDVIIEFILELVLEGGIEFGADKRVSKWIRYPLLTIVILFYAAIIFGLLVVGIMALRKDIGTGLTVLLIDLLIMVLTIGAFRKKYLEYKRDN